MPEKTEISAAAFADTKPHYNILDGLRGVAALTVVCYHLFEAFATSHIDQRINHGYLAVDFFFLLSGFVMGYAYDDRWNTMSVKDFIRRRLIRLHPMVVMGALIGAAMFYTQGCSVWDVTKISVGMLLLSTLLNALMIPVTTGFEIRGVGEMYPLNGPSWSLMFEYIGNLLYALFIRRFSTRLLTVLVVLAGCGLTAFSVWGPLGDIGAGFAMTGADMTGGSLRLLFSFSTGLLLSRVFKPVKVRGGILDRRRRHSDRGGHTAHRRQRASVDERRVRRLLRRGAVPAAGVCRRFGSHDRQDYHTDMQVPGGHILSSLHGALSVHISLLRMG